MSHGSEQSEDYWPGYVDALTSMVQVLAFVMMLLAVTVYVLSKSISKGAVEKIAKAANVSAPANTSVKELTEKIVEELSKPKPESKSESKSESKTASKSEAPAESTAEAKAEAAPASASKARSGEVQSEGRDPATINTMQRKAASSNVQAGADTDPPPNAKHITLRFAERSYRIEAAGAEAVHGFVEETGLAAGKGRIIIRAYASNANGAVTEGRHMAYYRAMVARQTLAARKVPPANIAIRIVDTPNPEQGGSIEIYAVPEGAP